MRGVSHQVAFFVFLAANAWLFSVVEDAGRVAVVIYGGSLAFLYGVSTLYHRPTWGEAGRKRMRSLDHSAIFVLIAGSYSPLFMALGGEEMRAEALTFMWSLASVGVLKSLFWVQGPKWIVAALAITMGWSAIFYAIELAPLMGSPCAELLYSCGAIYTFGALVYAFKRPDPWPETFGYHEVFHLCVIMGSLTHYAHTLLVLRAAGWLG
jgi:hemolysin III